MRWKKWTDSRGRCDRMWEVSEKEECRRTLKRAWHGEGWVVVPL